MVAPLVIAGIGLGLKGIGDFVSGGRAAGAQRDQTAKDFQIRQEQNRISREGLDASKTLGANDLRRQLETSGLRDRTLFALQNRTGLTPSRFNPKDLFNPQAPGSTPSQGGIDFSQLAGLNEKFEPGAGGVQEEMLRQMLAKLGFGEQQAPQAPPEEDPRARFMRGGGGGGGRFNPIDGDRGFSPFQRGAF